MRRESLRRLRRLTLAATVSLAMFSLIPVARPEEPTLAIRQTGGGSSFYGVSDIERVQFKDDTLSVITTGGSDSYALDSIVRIDFLWGSGIESPEGAAGWLKAMRLFQNRPNPFSPVTRIGFELAQAGRVELGIYSVDGRLIRTLVDEERTTGSHEVTWDGRDAEGKKVAGGAYFYKVAAPGIAESRQMILLP